MSDSNYTRIQYIQRQNSNCDFNNVFIGILWFAVGIAYLTYQVGSTGSDPYSSLDQCQSSCSDKCIENGYGYYCYNEDCSVWAEETCTGFLAKNGCCAVGATCKCQNSSGCIPCYYQNPLGIIIFVLFVVIKICRCCSQKSIVGSYPDYTNNLNSKPVIMRYEEKKTNENLEA